MAAAAAETAATAEAAAAVEEDGQLQFRPPGSTLSDHEKLLVYVDVVTQTAHHASTKVKCKACRHEFAATNERLAAHLGQVKQHNVRTCPSPPAEARTIGMTIMGRMDKNQHKTKTKKRKVEQTQDRSSKRSVRSMWDGAGTTAADAADAAHARFVFATGQAIGIGSNPFFLDLVKAVSAVPGWKPKDRRAIGSTALAREYDLVDKSSRDILDGLVPLYGKTLEQDGWTSPKGVPLVNLLESSNGTERFITAFDCSGEKKTMAYLANLVEPHIDDSVDLVMSDGACTGYLRIICARHPRITGMKCCARAVDLFLNDVAKEKWCEDIIRRNRKVVAFIKNHHSTSAIFATKTDLGLITPNTTRFATNVLSAQRTLKVSAALKNFGNDPKFAEVLRTATPTTVRTAGREVRRELTEGGDEVDDFFFELLFFVKIMESSLALLRMADGRQPCMGKFYAAFRALPGTWEKACAEQAVQAQGHEGGGFKDPRLPARLEEMGVICEKRRDYSDSPMLRAAYMCDPEFRDDPLLGPEGDNVAAGFFIMAKRLLIDHGPDAESSKIACAAYEAGEGGERVTKALVQLASYRGASYPGKMYLASAKGMPPAEWWNMFGRRGGCDDLAEVAIRCLSKIPASSGSERNWSLYGDVMGGRHARIGTEKARKLVFVRANLRLQTQEHTPAKITPWNEDDCESDIGSDGGGDDNEGMEEEPEDEVFRDSE